MLVKITNRCSMGCSHCMENSRPTSPHMLPQTFRATLAFIEEAESVARKIGYRLILLSGGEPTESPYFFEITKMAFDANLHPIMISNGSWLHSSDLREKVFREFPDILIQVTHDPRFYPSAPPRIDSPNIVYIDSLTNTIPLGRFSGKRSDLPEKKAPGSFNFRSLVRGKKDLREAIAELRLQALMGRGAGHCTPSIDHEGKIHAGESRFCHTVGTVYDTLATVTRNVLEMGSCNLCGLESKLDQRHLNAIGVRKVKTRK